MRLVLDRDADVVDIVERATGGRFTTVDACMGVSDDAGRMLGGFVFTGHTGTAIDLSLGGRGVVNRGAWCAVLHYVFDQLGCRRLGAQTRRSNKIVRRALPRLGFTYEGPLRRFYGDEDALSFSLTSDDLPAFRSRWHLKVAP